MKKKTNPILIALLALVAWYYASIALFEIAVRVLTLFVTEIGEVGIVLIQAIALIGAYLLIMDKRIAIFSQLHTKASLAKKVFVVGVLLLLIYMFFL